MTTAASAWDARRPMLTINRQINYLNAVAGEDAVAEAWVEHRGRSMVFCRAEVRTPRGTFTASASLVYKTYR